MMMYRQRSPLQNGTKFAVVWALIAAVTAVISFNMYSRTARNELAVAQSNILNAVEFYSRFLRNNRSITQKYEMLFAQPCSEAETQLRLRQVETLMMQNSFAYGHEYFLLRSVDGLSQIEIRRGSLSTRKTKIEISGEKDFLQYGDIFLMRSCLVGSHTHLCLVDIPNIREFIKNEKRTYTVLVMTIDEIQSLARYEHKKHFFHFFDPGLSLWVGDEQLMLSKLDGEHAWIETSAELGEGITLKSGYSFWSWLKFVGLLSAGLWALFVGIYTYIEKRIRIRVARNTELALSAEKIEAFERTKNLIQGVLHDIRSPLGALKMLARSSTDLQQRSLIELVTKRMQMIVSDLELRKKNADFEDYCLLPVHALVASVLSEKRSEYGNVVRLELAMPKDGLWAKGEYSELCRTLSNLLNNAYEASAKGGLIRIDGTPSNERFITLVVQDYGMGISKEMLVNLFQKGATFGKAGGSGLGLFAAKQTLEKMGGSIFIESNLGQGTSVTLTMPRFTVPNWEISSLELHEKSRLVLVDDDEGIYEFWKRKLLSTPINFEYYASPDAVPLELTRAPNIAWIVDNNFNGQPNAGLAFIRMHRLSEAILITTDWARHDVQISVEDLGVRMIGKDFLDQLQVQTNLRYSRHVEPQA